MRRVTLAMVIPLLLAAAHGGRTQQITFETLLRDMVDRRRIAEFPNPPFACRQSSSYNRDSVAPDKPGWFANADSSFFDGHTDVNGRREWIMMDVEGPGAIVRWWLTQQKFDGTVRIYLDGADEPIYAATADKIVGGDTIVGAPLSAVVGWNGRNLYLPIPYRSRCRITYDGPNQQETGQFPDCLYYNINTITYPEGTRVKTFRREDLTAHADLLAKVQSALREPGEHALPTSRTVPGNASLLRRGESLSRTVDGEGAISFLAVRIESEDVAQALRSVVITIAFDGTERASAPLGGFFGCGPSLDPYTGWWRQVRNDGWLACRWPMPFRTAASITLTNHGDHSVNVTLDDVGVSDWEWTDRTMYFHASWRSENNIATQEPRDWNYLTVEGQGVYAGDTLALYNQAMLPHPGGTGTWWGEGDEKVFVDREPFPSIFGTGTEDYYGYAWGVGGTFEAPFHAMPRGDANGNYTKPGRTTNTRVRSLDRIPFHHHLTFDMELLHWQKEAEVDYAVTTYWYAMDAAVGNGQVTPANVRAPVRRRPAETPGNPTQ